MAPVHGLRDNERALCVFRFPSRGMLCARVHLVEEGRKDGCLLFCEVDWEMVSSRLKLCSVFFRFDFTFERLNR